jgi:hypothetical protein
MYQTILGGMGAFLLASTAQTAAGRPIGLSQAAKLGTVIAAGEVTAIRAPLAARLFAIEHGERRRVFGTPSGGGKMVIYDLGPGEYWDAASARRFRVVARTTVEPTAP